MMGLSNGTHWVAWFIDSFMVIFCSILLLVLILWVSYLAIDYLFVV